jgi:hypothetical protein
VVRLTLSDDGKGLPLERSGTGMRMIRGLARLLATRTERSGDGRWRLVERPGTACQT